MDGSQKLSEKDQEGVQKHESYMKLPMSKSPENKIIQNFQLPSSERIRFSNHNFLTPKPTRFLENIYNRLPLKQEKYLKQPKVDNNQPQAKLSDSSKLNFYETSRNYTSRTLEHNTYSSFVNDGYRSLIPYNSKPSDGNYNIFN